MAQSGVVVQALKQELKRQGKTYANLAQALSLSEASVKRLFSAAGNISLARLDDICRFLGMSFSDLLTSLDNPDDRLRQLSREQEQELVANPKLLLVAVCALNRWGFQEILDTYTFTPEECVRLLAKLDRLGLIELLPKNRIKLLIHSSFAWLPHGPIQRFFRLHIQGDFFASDFTRPGEYMAFHNTMLSPSSNAILRRKMEQLLAEVHRLGQEDSKLPLADKYGTSMLVALRPWELNLFETMRRPGTEKHF